MLQNPFFKSITISFLLLSIAIYFLSNNNVLYTRNIVLTGNIFLAILTILSFLISIKTANDSNPNKFVRGVMKSTLLKFLVLILASFVLIYTQKNTLNKTDVFILMAVYIIYTIIENYYLITRARK